MSEAKAAAQRGGGPEDRPGRPVMKSKLMIGAAVVAAIGLALWVYSMATRPAPALSGGAHVTGFTSGGGGAPAAAAEPRLVDRAAPAMAKFGGSFVVGYFAAYAMRKFIKWSLIVAGLLTVGVVVLKKTGVVDLPWDQVEHTVEEGVDLAREHAGGAWAYLKSVAPSAVAAAVGGIFGFRRD
jgi:uncharacterized membrane protein (Fun14 family)